MIVVVASTSQSKLTACRAVLGDVATIVATKAASLVNEQPVGDETLQGARNRLGNARVIRPDGDLYISIESGLFEEDGQFIDRAVVLLRDRQGREVITQSDGVAFPADCVAEARARGFDRHTVGAVMEESGLVQDATDPHRDLGGQPRQMYIENALRAAYTTWKRHEKEGLSPKPR